MIRLLLLLLLTILDGFADGTEEIQHLLDIERDPRQKPRQRASAAAGDPTILVKNLMEGVGYKLPFFSFMQSSEELLGIELIAVIIVGQEEELSPTSPSLSDLVSLCFILRCRPAPMNGVTGKLLKSFKMPERTALGSCDIPGGRDLLKG